MFPSLAPAAYALRWRKAPLAAVRWADMRDGRSRDEDVPVEVTEVRGRVTRKGEPFPARIGFMAPNADVRVRTIANEDGRYRILLAQQGLFHVSIRDEGGRDFPQERHVAADTPETTCDFDVPANVVVVHARTEDGAPVVTALVSFDLNEPPPSGARKTFVYAMPVDSTGTVALPPLPPGILEVSARADGYRISKAPPVTITRETTAQDVVVTLRKGAGIRFVFVDSAGRPELKARIWSSNYGAIAGDDGVARFENPLTAGSPLIAYDSAEHMAFTRYGGEAEQTVRIPPSGPAIRVRFQHPDQSPVANSGIYVSVDGVLDDKRYVDQCMAAGGDWFSGADGLLRVAGLPAFGVVTLIPVGHTDLAVTRSLPVSEEITFTTP